MILTCPQCATRYFLPDVQVGRAGRSVKCTQCGTVWRAEPEPDREPEPQPEPPRIAAEPAYDPEAELAGSAQRRAEILKERKEERERRARGALVVNTAICAGVAAALALSAALAVVFRVELVKLIPSSATAYAAIGLPVNASGLLIDKVQATPTVRAGQRALAVTGILTNVSAAARPAPAFRVTILDRAGKALAQQTVTVTAATLKVGEARHFSLYLFDPPAGFDTVEVTLALPRAPVARSGPR